MTTKKNNTGKKTNQTQSKITEDIQDIIKAEEKSSVQEITPLQSDVAVKKDFPWKSIRETIVVIAAIATAFSAYFAYHAFDQTRKSVELSIAAGISANNFTPTQFLVDYPDLLPYFDKSARDASISDEVLMEQFNALGKNDEEKKLKNLIMAGVFLNADSIEMTFTQRNVIPACDWNGWWHYYCDLYDESPVLQDYLKKRSTWYLVDDAIVKGERGNYFMPTESTCIEGKINK